MFTNFGLAMKISWTKIKRIQKVVGLNVLPDVHPTLDRANLIRKTIVLAFAFLFSFSILKPYTTLYEQIIILLLKEKEEQRIHWENLAKTTKSFNFSNCYILKRNFTTQIQGSLTMCWSDDLKPIETSKIFKELTCCWALWSLVLFDSVRRPDPTRPE